LFTVKTAIFHQFNPSSNRFKSNDRYLLHLYCCVIHKGNIWWVTLPLLNYEEVPKRYEDGTC
jgi:hypothetical protein